MADILPGYIWHKDLNRYRDMSSGRFVSRQSINEILTAQTSEAEARLGAIATAYYEGRISPASFAEQLRTETRRNALQNMALAKGGFDQLTQADYGRAGQALRGQYAQIVGTAIDVTIAAVTIGQLLNRMAGYAGEARRLYYVTLQETMHSSSADMVTIARRVLGDAQHCADCLMYYERGWQLLTDAVPPSVACQCTTHCRCSLLIREVPRAELDQWLGTKR